jgi:hypothetical protein
MPLDNQFRYGTGLEFSFLRWLKIGACYEFVALGKAPIDLNRGPLAGRLAGEYSSNFRNVVTLYAAARL